MSDFFSAFNKVSKEDWEAKLIADLKGKDPSLLQIDDEIEELNMTVFQHTEDALHSDAIPGNFPYSRGMNTPNNNWNNGFLVTIENEANANRKALKALNSGADLLVFKSTKTDTNWSTVLKDIQLEHIQAQFVVNSEEDFNNLRTLVSSESTNIQYNIDFLEDHWTEENFNSIATNFKNKQQAFCSISGFKVQLSGATTWQELAFCLSAGHDYLVKLINLGFTVDQAAACITFKIGIGSNYFYEIAKIRSLKGLWSKVVRAYQPDHNCSYNCNITAVLGHQNKSLSDPYTNLLRQTTEAMSAINGGVNGIVILPYDSLSTNGSSGLAERMALNISSILKEESYLDKVIDPLGGSYSLEKLTDAIGRKAWEIFQQLEKSGGIFSTTGLEHLKRQVNEKRSLRIQKFNSGETVGIGINKYPNIETVENNWQENREYLGMSQLILENEHKTAVV